MSKTKPRIEQYDHYKILFGQFPRAYMFTWKLWRLTCWTRPKKCQTSDEADSDRKKIRQELIACRSHGEMIESRGTLRYVRECILFQVAGLPPLCHDRLWLNSQRASETQHSLWEKKTPFPKTAAWFLYEVQRHPRWAWTRGSLLNLTLNTPNKPAPLEISFEKLSRLVFFGFFLYVSFSRGCPCCNIADVNHCEKRRREKVERIRRSWPLFRRESYLCERGEGSSLGYETSDFWCWQEMLTFAIKLKLLDD